MAEDAEMAIADGSADSDSDDSSSSGSDFQEIDAGPEDMNALEELRHQLDQNPRQYNVHCQVPAVHNCQLSGSIGTSSDCACC